MCPTIAVVGASADRSKYGNRCVRAYARRGWQVFPINPNETTVEGFQAYPSLADVPLRVRKTRHGASASPTRFGDRLTICIVILTE